MDSWETALSTYREEPDSVLALRGRLQLDLARELPRTALDLPLTGGPVVVNCSSAELLDGWGIQIRFALKLELERVAAEDRKNLGWSGLDGLYPVRGL